MDHQPSLYDRDILAWAEAQADILRRLKAVSRDLPPDLDLDNIVEEIESVGRSELVAVESNLIQMLVHLVKLAADPDGEPARHWAVEIIAFQGNAQRRFTPSMARRIDMDDLWRDARRRLRPTAGSGEMARIIDRDACPLTMDELLNSDAPDRLADRLVPLP